MKSTRTMEKAVKTLESFNANALKALVILLPWLAPLPSAVFIAIAANTSLHADWITSVIIGAFLDGFGIVSIALYTRMAEYNSQRREGEPYAPTNSAKLLIGAYLLSSIWLTVFLKIFPTITKINPIFANTELVLNAISYAIFPLITISGASALTLNTQHDALVEMVKTDRVRKLAQAKKDAEKEARRIARLEKEAARARQVEIPVAQKILVSAPIAIPDEYKDKISTKLANDPRYVAFFLEQVKRNGSGMMPVEEIMKLTGVPRKTAYNYAGYYRRDTKNG